MPLQERPVFLLKRFLPVMFLLPGDVFTDGGHVGFGNRKRTITCLPRESGELGALCLDPLGRGFFDLLDSCTDGNSAGQLEEDVNVVLDGIDKHRGTTNVLQHGRHVSVKGITNPVGNDSLSVFGAKNEVDVQTGKRLWHGLGRPFRA